MRFVLQLMSCSADKELVRSKSFVKTPSGKQKSATFGNAIGGFFRVWCFRVGVFKVLAVVVVLPSPLVAVLGSIPPDPPVVELSIPS